MEAMAIIIFPMVTYCHEMAFTYSLFSDQFHVRR